MILRFFREQWQKKALWIPLAFAFLLVSLSRIDDGGTNARARFATLRAMSDYQTFQIDEFVDWTEDWAQTPDGHYYSNKAPGPTLIAFPVFWGIDQVLWKKQDKLRDIKGRRQEPRGIHKVAISTLYQVLPFLILSLCALGFVISARASPLGYLFSGIAIFFGNTAAVLMSSYMGNPFAAMAMMGLVVAYFYRHLAFASLAFGWMLLSDYPTALILLPFLNLFWPEIKKLGFFSSAKLIFLGALIPGALWIWYHTVCFGSPFALPFSFKVAAIEGTVSGGSSALGGKTSLLPNPAWLAELLFGTKRGLLFTQPWLLLCAVLPFFWKIPELRLRRLHHFAVMSLAILVFENAGFPGWHGGGSPGPRYLSAALPLFGLFLPHLFQVLQIGRAHV